MKKTLLLLGILLVLVPVLLFADSDVSDAEKYFSKATQYYIEGDLDEAINVLTIAIQKDPSNTKYEALYDVVLNERDNLKVIDIRGKDKLSYLDENQFNQLKKYINESQEQYKSKVQKLIKIMSKENAGLAEKQKNLIQWQKYLYTKQNEIVEKKLPSYEAKVQELQVKSEDNFMWILFVILFILFFILMGIFVIMTYSRRIKKLKQSIKYLKVRQDEQMKRLLHIEELQKRLDTGDK